MGSPPQTARIDCSCGKWLLSGVITTGYVQMACRREHAIVRVSPSGVQHIEVYRESKAPKPKLPGPLKTRVPKAARLTQFRPQMTGEEIVALVEERWTAVRGERAWRKAELAVGLRFDVLSRDGFRCQYCGRGPDQGVLLEVDHRVARANGGTDEMRNLVTACWDCNRGKSDKVLVPAS